MDAYEAGAALCEPFLAQLPVAGVSISMVSGSGAQSTVGTSDPIAARLDELQFQLGEGPTPDAVRTSRAVLVPDLAAERAGRRWPVFAPAAQEAGARALFSFPMSVGVTTVGVVSMYASTSRGPWPGVLLQTAAALVATTAQPAVELATHSAAAEQQPGPRQIELRREVHQAAGMVMMQLDSTIEEAMSRLRARAFSQGQPIDLVARAVVSGALHFADLDD
ncbi:MAG: ANTAR domain-containing protein [Acidobacteria bacterium]|nr:ANTAR domain-containing protein [Acidobacteriota bacterium]